MTEPIFLKKARKVLEAALDKVEDWYRNELRAPAATNRSCKYFAHLATQYAYRRRKAQAQFEAALEEWSEDE